mgnify:CR=1 FL=1
MGNHLISYSCATFIGKRKNNQDNLAVDGSAPFVSNNFNYSDARSCPAREAHLFAVSDGIGGLGDSADISRNTVEILCREFAAVTAQTDLSVWIRETLDLADAEARRISAECGTSGGTTATVAVADTTAAPSTAFINE